MTSRMLDLNNVRYLLEAAESGSFSAAGRVFGVPPSLVSRRIARLEEEVGARLFQRTTRAMTLTDAGQMFLEHARAGMQSFDRAEALLAPPAGSIGGRIRLSAPVGMADALWPCVSRFLADHPDIRIEIDFADRIVDLVTERMDLAIRASADRSDRLIGRRLVDAPRCLFASPSYLAAHGRPRTVAAVADHACVILGTSTDRVEWTIHVGRRRHRVLVGGRIAVNEARLAADCAADGLGIAFLPWAACRKHVAAGALTRVLPRANGGETSLWLVYPDRNLPPASRALAEFLVRELPDSLRTRGAAPVPPLG